MRLSGLHLRQRDGVTCGPTVAVVAGVLLDPDYRAALMAPGARTIGANGQAWFAGEQARVHAEVNRVWPRRLGTTPLGMARALTARSAGRGVRYRWRPFRGRRDSLADVLGAVDAGWPVPMLIGRTIPRHWVLLVGSADGVPPARSADGVLPARSADGMLRCYEPSSGRVLPAQVEVIRRSGLTGLGFPRPFAFVVPTSPADHLHSNV